MINQHSEAICLDNNKYYVINIILYIATLCNRYIQCLNIDYKTLNILNL